MLAHWFKTIWAKGGGVTPSWGPTIIFSEKKSCFLNNLSLDPVRSQSQVTFNTDVLGRGFVPTYGNHSVELLRFVILSAELQFWVAAVTPWCWAEWKFKKGSCYGSLIANHDAMSLGQAPQDTKNSMWKKGAWEIFIQSDIFCQEIMLFVQIAMLLKCISHKSTSRRGFAQTFPEKWQRQI